MRDELLSLFGETVEKPAENKEVPQSFYVIYRIKTALSSASGKPYYVFILKGTGKSLRMYSENRNWFGNQIFHSKEKPGRTVPIEDRIDNGRAYGWLHDKLAGLI